MRWALPQSVNIASCNSKIKNKHYSVHHNEIILIDTHVRMFSKALVQSSSQHIVQWIFVARKFLFVLHFRWCGRYANKIGNFA